MKKRRDFLKFAGLASLQMAAHGVLASSTQKPKGQQNFSDMQAAFPANNRHASPDNEGISVIGPYGPWAADLSKGQLPTLSFRLDRWGSVEEWRKAAGQRLRERLSIPDIGVAPDVKVNKQYAYDGLHVEELSWQLPYGRPTEAFLLRPLEAKGKLPGILAFHDHGGDKYFGARKIIRTTDEQHPLLVAHQKQYYESLAWANEIAKRGYVVLIPDAFPFASRRVMIKDVPPFMRQGLSDDDPENPARIKAYNAWASEQESVMAKSLFCAGTTWAGVFFAEDRVALDILCSRPEVDATRLGCGGLSGGGMRTVFMGGLEPRIQCAVCVGFMTTWDDFLLNKSVNHTWMTYVPIFPNEMDFPEILGLRAPLATLVLNDEADDLYTLPQMRQADKILQGIYQKVKMPNRYRCSYYPGPHKFDRAMQKEAFAWFDQWLYA